jgi:hypothetical protein
MKSKILKFRLIFHFILKIKLKSGLSSYAVKLLIVN